MNTDEAGRARVALATTAREVADLARGTIGDVPTAMRPGERVRAARQVRLYALQLVQDAVRVELADGATWETVAVALAWVHPGMDDADRAAAITACAQQFEPRELPTWGDDDAADEHQPGRAGDLEQLAAALDAYYDRHAEPWDDRGATPVSDGLRVPRRPA